MTSGQSQEIVFFIDRCLGSKRIVTALKVRVLPSKYTMTTLPKMLKTLIGCLKESKRGWVILTKDARIGKNHLERMAVTNAGISMFTLASQNLSGKEMADIFLKSITKMQEFVRQHPAPFIAKVYRDGRALDVERCTNSFGRNRINHVNLTLSRHQFNVKLMSLFRAFLRSLLVTKHGEKL